MGAAYTAAEARERFAAILDEVGDGAEVTITRHGKPVAVIVSPSTLEALRGEDEAGFAALYASFLRTSDLARHGVDLSMLAALRERPAGRGGR
jgi:prevent-host-death family protein